MQRPRLKTKMSKKKKAALAAAIALVLALLIGGAFAWTDFSQSFKNLFHGTSTPDVLLHDDFTPNVNKDVYVENTGQTPLVVRVQFAEYLQVGNDAVIGQDAKDSSTWRVRDWSGTTIGTDGVIAANDNLHDWLMSGNSKWYLPGTSEIDDVTYTSAVTGGNGNTTKQTLPAAPVVTMSAYLADKANLDASYPDGFWILDDSDTGSGWCYWSKLLPKDEATNLLLDNVTLNPDMTPDDNWAYNIDVRLQAANKTEAYKLGSVGGISSEGKALINSLLGLNTIANPQDKFDSGSDQLLNLKPVPGYPGLYEVLDDNGKSARPKEYLVDPDGSVKDDSTLSGDEVSADADFVSRLTKTYPSGLPSGDAEALSESNGYPVVVDDNGDVLIDGVNFPDPMVRLYISSGWQTAKGYTDKSLTPVADSSTDSWQNVDTDPIDTNGDGVLSSGEIAAVTELLFNNARVSGNAMGPNNLVVSSLEGIEIFPNLGVLQASGSNIDAIDPSYYPQLKNLLLSTTNITSLDVSKNPLLETLSVYGTYLTTLDTSRNPELKDLTISNTKIASLDVSSNSKLQTLNIEWNNSLNTRTDANAPQVWGPLTSLNISGLTSLKTLTIANQSLTTLDVSGCSSLETLTADVYNTSTWYGNMGHGTLTSITGLSDAAALTTLNVFHESLTSLDLDGLSNLVNVQAYNNNLSSISLVGCTSLTTLWLQNTAGYRPIDPSVNNHIATLNIRETAITNNSTNLRIMNMGTIELLCKTGFNYTNATYHTAGNTLTVTPGP